MTDESGGGNIEESVFNITQNKGGREKMKLKKRIISLLVGISLLTIGIFTSCDNPSGPSNGTEDVKKTEEKGIKLTWGDLPANVKHLSIETMIGSRSYYLFEINMHSF